MPFNARLKEARQNSGLTQEALGEIIGAAKSTIAGYEKGTSEPSVQKINDIMRALNVDANFLWQDEMEKRQKKAPSESKPADEITKNEPPELTVARPGDSRLQSLIDCYNSISRAGKERLLELATMYANNPQYQKVNTDNHVSNYVIIANDGSKLAGTIQGDLIDEVKDHPSSKPDL